MSAQDDGRMRDGLIAGSESVLAEVYDAYSPIVFGMALQVTRDRGAAEDITQEVFVELWRRPERFDPQRAPLRGWLCMISRRRGIDWVRRSQSRESTRLAAMEPAPVGFEDDLLESTAHKQVRRAIADLPAAQRQAVLLAFYGGLSYREVARTLSVPEGTVKWRMRSALRRIGEQLRAEGFDRADLD